MTLQGTDLTVVTVTTKLGAKYVFPDMPQGPLDNIVRSSAWITAGRLILVNISAAVLSIDSRLVRSVEYNGEVQWENPE